MKAILVGILQLSLALTASAQNKLIINGSLQGNKGKMIVYVRNLDNTRMDSATAHEGKFILEMQVPTGDIYYLQAGKNGSLENSSLLIYLQPGELNISGKGPLLKDLSLTGSQFVLDFNSFSEKLRDAPELRSSYELTRAYQNAVNKNNVSLIHKLELQLAKDDTIRASLAEQWVHEHPGSSVSSFVIYVYIKPYRPATELEQLLAKLSPEARDNAVARKLQNSIEISKLTAIGKQAPDFTQNDLEGKPVSLQNLLGKYVLIDFWASWCLPCREENPNLVKAFNKYRSRNFMILGVSLDKEKSKWSAAIHKDGLDWMQVSDLKYWDNDVARLYDIAYIPANLLIDTKGRIIAKNIRGDELTAKLKEIFGY